MNLLEDKKELRRSKRKSRISIKDKSEKKNIIKANFCSASNNPEGILFRAEGRLQGDDSLRKSLITISNVKSKEVKGKSL